MLGLVHSLPARVRKAAGPFLIAALGALTLSASAATFGINGGGAKIFVDFNNPQSGKVLFVGSVPSIQGLTLNGLMVNVNVGGLQRQFTLDAKGQDSRPPNLFELRDTGSALVFAATILDNTLANTYSTAGITNQNATDSPISLPTAIGFANNSYLSTLVGEYDAVQNQTGTAYLGIIKAPKNPRKPTVKITTIKARPNPVEANAPVTIKGIVNISGLEGPVAGNLNFGDGSTPLNVTGDLLRKMLAKGIQHQYANDGVFTVRIAFVGANEIGATRLFVVVGGGYDVNQTNGGYTHLMRAGSGTVNLEIGIGNVPGSSTAETTFKNQLGNPAGVDPGFLALGQATPRTTPSTGTQVSRVFLSPGLYVSESRIVDGTSNLLGMVRKTIIVTPNDIANSTPMMVRTLNGVKTVVPRDEEADNPITLTNMKGKFRFTTSQLDKVVFNGTVELPAGYAPRAPDGNDISMGMGNVLDTVHMDEKNKIVFPTTTGVISKFRLIPPRLANGVAVGGEVARISITMNVADLDIQGFDSEGITVDIRSDEAGQSAVERFVQVNMLLAGQSFSALVPVDYAVTTGGDFGNFSGRAGN